MSFTLWIAVFGAVLLILALTSSYLRWMPVTTSAVCLLLGIGIGPMGLGLLRLDIDHAAGWLKHLTEVALLFSLFISGLKLRLSLRSRVWRVAFGLAGPVMLLTIGGFSVVLHYLGNMAWAPALLVGAILAPTDPVLAALVQVNNAQDHDPLRFGLSGEAGLNDGVAFPFVLLGLLLVQGQAVDGSALFTWLWRDLLWAMPVGLLVGYWMGKLLGRLTLTLRISHADSTLTPNDYLALALIALAYVVADTLHAYGFLAVFAAGLGLRQAEVSFTGDSQTPSEHLAQPVAGHLEAAPENAVHGDLENLEDTQVAAGVMMGDMLAFGSLVERVMEVFLVTVLGVALASHWDWRALGFGLALFCVVRPLSVLLMPWGKLLDIRQRLMVGWFGIRGIGSLFYLFYAMSHGLDDALAAQCLNIILSVVALSIVVHGLSTQPMLNYYGRRG